MLIDVTGFTGNVTLSVFDGRPDSGSNLLGSGTAGIPGSTSGPECMD